MFIDANRIRIPTDSDDRAFGYRLPFYPSKKVRGYQADDKCDRHGYGKGKQPDKAGDEERIGPDAVPGHLDTDKDEEGAEDSHRYDGEHLGGGKEQGKDDKDQAGDDACPPVRAP